jgi:hypothetical protein
MNINGKDVSLRFGMLSVEIFLGEAAKFDGLSYYSSYAISKIIYAGMVNYYEVKGQKHPCTFEEIYDFVENSMLTKADMSDITEVINEFSNCQAIQRKGEDLAEINDEIKKKGMDGMKPELQPMQQD